MEGPVLFTGFLQEDEFIASLKAAKMFVQPSTREGSRIMTLEAMDCGLPAITLDVPKNYMH